MFYQVATSSRRRLDGVAENFDGFGTLDILEVECNYLHDILVA